MKSSLPSPNKIDIRRFQIIYETGCIVTRLIGLGYNSPDIHHILLGGKRISHQHTIGLSPYHHRGIISTGFTKEQMYDRLGPSMALNPKEFEERFGTQEYLLDVQNKIINKYMENFI